MPEGTPDPDRQPLDVHYDSVRDILTIDQVPYSGQLFRAFHLQTRPGRALRIIKPARPDEGAWIQEFELPEGFEPPERV